jgi:hypothetical protein
MKVSTICFAIFSPEISYKVFLNVPPLLSFDCCPQLHPLMPFAVVLSFLKYRDRLLPKSFIFLPPSWCVRYLFPSVRPSQVSCSTFSLVRFYLTTFTLRRATPPRRITPLQEAANIFGIHYFPRSVPSALRAALQIGSGPYAAYSALCQFPMLHLS